MIIAGLMTGTSADALDLAVVDFTLEEDRQCSHLDMRIIAAREIPLDEQLALDMLRLIEPREVPLALVADVDARLGQASGEAVSALASELGITPEVVVSHGQTVRHEVVDGHVTATLQLGQPAWIAEATGAHVLSDVRSSDVAAGGQGAPLVGILDQLLLADRTETTALLNLGGIANITVVSPSDNDLPVAQSGAADPTLGSGTVAFDTGPANALIDLMARRITGEPRAFDADGAFAARGRTDAGLLADLLADPYYALPAPKSTGKEKFHADYLDRALEAHPHLGDCDVIATVTSLTARTIAEACRAHNVTSVIASGGGTRNPTLMAELAAELGEEVRLQTTDEALGLPEGAKEACLMALIGWLSFHGLPTTVPQLTGAIGPRVAGRWTPGNRPLQLPEPIPAFPTRLKIRHSAADSMTHHSNQSTDPGTTTNQRTKEN